VSFTSPKTWSFGEILTSSDMNTYVRDNTLNLFNRFRILQVVQTVKTDTFSANLTQGTISAVTGLSVAITPSSASSLVFVLANVNGSTTDVSWNAHLFRNASAANFRGNAAGSRQRAIGSGAGQFVSEHAAFNVAFQYLDSPATTSATTYDLRVSHNGPSSRVVYVNRSEADTNTSRYTRGASSITAIEVTA